MQRILCSLPVLLLVVLTGACGRQDAVDLAERDIPLSTTEPLKLAKCQGDSFRLDLLGALDTLPDDEPSAHLEQLRDWVWTALLARLAARQVEPELLAGTVRQPLFRDEAFSHLLDLPVGRSRATIGKGGTVYVLVQRSSPQRTYEDVLEAIDQEALSLGGTPASAVVYGLDFDWRTAEAGVCRLTTVDRAWIESSDQGFRRAKLAAPEDLARFLEGGVDLLSAHSTGGGLGVAGRVRRRVAGAPITVEHVAALTQARGEEDLGFSLDPRTDVAEVARRLDQLIGALVSPGRLAAVLSEWGATPEDALKLALETDHIATTRTSLKAVRAAVNGERRQTEAVLAQASGFRDDPLLAELIQHVAQSSGYQCARYDGPTEGTLPAMTMFYTDLVAKLWAIDWQRSAPTGRVPGFVSIPEHRISTAYCGGDEGVPFTRIWFGARPEGFLRDAPAAVRFAPVATRLFALGSALGSEHSDEVEPAAEMLRFIRWWDRNYAGVAAWEPQYELLNQLMKWTLVRRMAEASGSAELAFLAPVEVGRSHRLDTWMSRQRDLRLKDRVQLAAKAGEPTECLRLYESPRYAHCGRIATLSGGVSLPRTEEIAGRPLRAPQPEPFLAHVEPETSAQRDAEGRFV